MDYFLLTNNLTKATGKLDNLIDGTNFCSSMPIISWNIELPNLKNSSSMFNGCKKLKNIKASLRNITSANQTFRNCESLEYFEDELPYVTDCLGMCGFCYSLRYFKCNMKNAKNIDWAFQEDHELISFEGDTPAMTNSYGMFTNCYKLESFKGRLDSLVQGHGMFDNCKLNIESVQCVADTINNLSNDAAEHKITLGMNASLRDDEELSLLRQEAINKLLAKGWTVTEKFRS